VIKSAKPSIMPESPEAEELAWDRLEIFRSQIATPKPRQWLKPAIGICILLIVLAVSAYQLFRLRSTQNSRNPDHSVSDTSKARVKAESIAKVQPEYPRLPRKQRVAGTVVLEADIDEKGDVVRAKAISGPDQLRKAAEEALMKWKFKPASVNGIAIASKEQISIVLEPPK
jgi:TonB family protein